MPNRPAADRGHAGCRSADRRGSTTNRVVIGRPRAFIAWSASAASASGPIVRGDSVMTSPTWRDSRSGPMARRRSPSVTMPTSRAAGIDHAKTAEALLGHHQQRARPWHVGRASGTASRHASGRAPAAVVRRAGHRDETDGNRPAVNPRRVSSATASASPSAICIVVDWWSARAPSGRLQPRRAAAAQRRPRVASVDCGAGGDGDQRQAEAAGMGDEIGQFGGFAGIGQSQHRVAGDDHAQIAMRGLGRVDEQSGRAG